MALEQKLSINAFGLTFRGLSKTQLLNSAMPFLQIITCNAEIIDIAHHDSRLKTLIENNYATIDGQVPFWFASRKNKTIAFEKIAGSDFIFDICQTANVNKQKVFLLGDWEKINESAVTRLREQYQIEIEGFSPPLSDYPFSQSVNDLILKKISAFQPHYLLVGLGCPKQDFWIDDHRESLESFGVKLAIGVGGTFKFVSGTEKRAPEWIQRSGLESLWRVIQNPTRIGRFLRNFKLLKYIRK